MTVGAIEQSTGGTNFDAVAALRTVEPAAIGSDHSSSAAATGFDRIFAHPFVANARAAFTENAALRIVCHHRREVSFGLVILFFGETLFQSTPIKGHLLQFAFAAAIAYWTIERMIGQQKFEHRALGLFNLVALSGHNHAVSADDRA